MTYSDNRVLKVTEQINANTRKSAQNGSKRRGRASSRRVGDGGKSRDARNAFIGFLAAILFLFPSPNGSGALCIFGAQPANAQNAELRFEATSSTRSDDNNVENTMFARIRALDLSSARALATKRSTAIALATSRIGAAQSDLKDQQNRLKLNSAGGLDPFSGKVRFYLSLDMERLLGLNKAAKSKARRVVEVEQIGKTEATNGAVKDVTAAWYGLRRSETAVVSAARYKETARALYVSSDAKFKAGAGELSGVLSALDGTFKSEEAYNTARQNVALACLDLAQACGYTTAEEMEAALRQ